MPNYVKRLFNQFHPEKYHLSITIDNQKMIFSGQVIITGKKTGRVNKRFTFHQKDLTISSATIDKLDKNNLVRVPISRINHHNTLNEIRLHSNDLIYPGNYQITMNFSGKINTGLNGIYQAFFKDNGVSKTIITTQFESHYARQAFPCIDEPEAKAIFSLNLTTDKNLTTLSNMPITKTKINDNLKIVNFEDTPPMSTYLLAFTVGELEYKEGKTKDGIVVRTYATPDKIKLTSYSIKIAIQALEFFSDYFKMPYPLQKLDMVAIPDFSAGAMENWGLITYRETCLLTNELDNNIDSLQQIALVISHEISHQWFGNLVTMKWWNDLWLNESFANLMEYKACSIIYPEWNIFEQFVKNEVNAAKKRDSLINVQPIRTSLKHPDEISTLFDPSIVYAKGGSVLYMLMNYIGENNFRDGLKIYFDRFKYQNTTADDLWSTISEVSKLDVKGFMNKWINVSGYPIVEIDWQPHDSRAKISQSRFLIEESNDYADNIWQIPLASNQAIKPELLTKKSSNIFIPKSENNKVMILNKNGESYYLPYYKNKDHLALITQNIKYSTAIDRFSLIDNYNLFQRSRLCQLTDVLNLINGYRQEEDDNVWSSISMTISEVRRLIEGNEKLKHKMNSLINELITELISKIGFDDRTTDSSKTIRLRILILSIAASADNLAVITEFNNRFNNFKKPADLNPNIRHIIYYTAIKNDKNFNFMLKLHNSLTIHDEKEEVATALTSTKNPTHIKTLLELLKSDNIKKQNIMYIFSYLISNYSARTLTWDWMKDNWTFIEESFKSEKNYGFFARIAANYFSTTEQLENYQDFFEPKINQLALKRDVLLGIAEIKSRIAWRDYNQDKITSWLNKTKSI